MRAEEYVCVCVCVCRRVCVCVCVCRLHVGSTTFNNRINLLPATVSFFQELSKMRFLFLQAFTVGFRIFYIILGSILPRLLCALAWKEVGSAADIKSYFFHPQHTMLPDVVSPLTTNMAEKWLKSTVFMLINLLWHSACFFLGTPSSLTYMEPSLLPSNISGAGEVDTPFMAWIQPSTMSGLYASDTTVTRNSHWPQCEMLASRTTSNTVRNWTNASKSASPPDSLLGFNLDSQPLILHSVLSSSLQMPVPLQVHITEDGVSTTHSWQWTNHRTPRPWPQPHPILSCLCLLLSLLCMHAKSL